MSSYLAPHFDPDVFVSYSHGAPRDPESPLKRWAQALVRRLESQLRALDTEFDELNLWIDRQIDPTALLTDELKGKVSASGILMIVMSKRYLASDWCKDELGWFHEQVQGRTVAGGRVFIIRAQETDTNLWPAFLRDERGHAIPGFTFHESEDRASPLSFELGQPNDEYFKALGVLRTWLSARLREMRDRAARNAQAEMQAATPSRPMGERQIYLYAHPDDDSARIDIARALYHDHILPLTATHASARGRLPDWLSEDSGRLGEARKCEALALVRANGGDRFRSDLLYVGVTERERIAVARGARLPCAVLDKTGESLPIDVAPWGIERFDVNRAGWRGEFLAWLDAERASSSRAAL